MYTFPRQLWISSHNSAFVISQFQFSLRFRSLFLGICVFCFSFICAVFFIVNGNILLSLAVDGMTKMRTHSLQNFSQTEKIWRWQPLTGCEIRKCLHLNDTDTEMKYISSRSLSHFPRFFFFVSSIRTTLTISRKWIEFIHNGTSLSKLFSYLNLFYFVLYVFSSFNFFLFSTKYKCE